MKRLGVAFVGCGFVADYYIRTLEQYTDLELVGVWDRDLDRLARWSSHFKVKAYSNYDELLADENVHLVVNLTNPASHYSVSRQAILAGKHVYSEKPLATEFADAQELVRLANQQKRLLSSAPCNLYSESAQTFWRALKEQRIGTPYLVYAELDDGLVHRMPFDRWLSESGNPWPARDEFQVGCTLEHAGYYLSWLVAFFGEIESLTAYGSVTVANKNVSPPLDQQAPDFTVGCLRFASGISARITCSIVAPHDHHLKVFGEQGVLTTKDCWFYRSPVYSRRFLTIRRKTLLSPIAKKHRLVGRRTSKFGYRGSQQMDFARGIHGMKQAITTGENCYLSADYCLHINEASLAISSAGESGRPYTMQTKCPVMEPLQLPC